MIDTFETKKVRSPIGPLTLASRDGKLTALHLDPPAAPLGKSAGSEVLEEAARQLDAYFAGKLTDFDLPLSMGGSDFQRRVWDCLRLIPYGETWSYGQVAQKVGNSKACRAVGMANNRNPIAIIVPCHRVIGAGGALVGYGGGLDRKSWLLDHERRVRAK
jgi:methylated-DNA-[protein]-cysteine S-methyltransferase